MAESKKRPGFYERSGPQSSVSDSKNKSKELKGDDNICNKCSKFDKKTIDSCNCASRYRETRKINKV